MPASASSDSALANVVVDHVVDGVEAVLLVQQHALGALEHDRAGAEQAAEVRPADQRDPRANARNADEQPVRAAGLRGRVVYRLATAG